MPFTVFVLQDHYRGNLATIFIVEAVLVVGAVSLDLLVSAAARNECDRSPRCCRLRTRTSRYAR